MEIKSRSAEEIISFSIIKKWYGHGWRPFIIKSVNRFIPVGTLIIFLWYVLFFVIFFVLAFRKKDRVWLPSANSFPV